MNWHNTLRNLQVETVAKAASLWGADPDSLELVGVSANAVYRFTRQGETHYLRCTHPALRDHAGFAAGLDYQQHAWLAQAQVCQPLPSQHDRLIEDIGQDEDVFLASASQGINGHALGDQINPQQLEAWGEALGTLHKAAENYQAVPLRLSSGALQLPERFTLLGFWEKIAHALPDTQLKHAHAELTGWLKGLPETEMLVTHGDFRPANAIWDGRRVVIVDFDEPTLAWAEYDIARAMLRDQCQAFEHPKTHLETFLRGYERVRKLPNARERVPHFVRVRALLMLAWSLETAWHPDAQRALLHWVLEGWNV